MYQRPIIALVGRPNVGKSALFNRMIGRREAITNYEAGTTRDRHFGSVHWFGHVWTLIDTAGMLFEDDEQKMHAKELYQAMEEQVLLAVEEASLIAMVVDVKEGVQSEDMRLIELLRKHNKPIIILANKADNYELRQNIEPFYRFGVKEVFPVSAIHGTGINDVIDYFTAHYPSPAQEETRETPRVTFIGRPNVGKSTLLNQILGEKRAIVSETPGTTRDSIEAPVTLPSGNHFVLVDTAGIRRRGKVELGIERFSLFRTIKAINQSDIVVLLLTIEEAPTRGDAHVAMYALEANKNIILLLNKSDLARDNIFAHTKHKQHNIGQRFLHRFPFMQRLPYYFVSGQTGQGVAEFMKELETYLVPEKKKIES